MTPPIKVLINGAGVAGPALATMLLSSPRAYAITVVERAAALRTGGHQIDLRSQGIPVMRRMGLLDTVRARCVRETGIAFVDATGRSRAVLGMNDSGHGQQGLTSEYEIMRGDLVDVLYRASLVAAEKKVQKTMETTQADELLRYEFGKHATHITQQHGARCEEVDVAFSDGTKGSYDLVVGADGQGSRTRQLVFGEDSSNAAFRSLGVYNAFFTIPVDLRVEGDRYLAKMYHAPGRRTLATRTGNQSVTQASMSTMRPSPALVAAMSKGLDGTEEQKTAFEELFRDAGWQAERLIKGMRSADDFYTFVAAQVMMDEWHKGKVALLGDAGYCPSPNTGMGTTCSLVGAYILAGELVKHGRDFGAALRAYEAVAKPFVDQAQKLAPGMPKLWFRDTQLGVRTMHFLLAAFTTLKIDKLLFRLMPKAKDGLVLPDYPDITRGVE